MSDAAFSEAVKQVLIDEGGYADRPDDSGGPTKYGISQRSYPNLDIAALTETQATMIYEHDWWDRYGYGRLPDAIGAKIFNLAVNMGPEAAAKLLQGACTDCGEPVVADGQLGPATVAAAMRCDQGELLAAVREGAAQHYRQVVVDNPKDAEFLDGWLRRAAA